VAVAYSGGRDSTALLHATVAVARTGGLQVLALHVHHGLSRHADAWLEHGRAQCAAWAAEGWPVTFQSRRVEVEPQGRGIEAAAREARYRALADMARDAKCDLVLLAHHCDDQAETVLLQALRGAGMAGLSAMPREVERTGIVWARPWLGRSRAELQAYVELHGLCHVEDDSNADPRHARNRLRLMVWPELDAGFKGAADALGAVARHAQEATACLAALAEIDLRAARSGAALDLAALGMLDVARRSNALRHWLAGVLGQAPAASLMQRLVAEPALARTQAWPIDKQRELRLYRGVLSVAAARWSGPAANTRADAPEPWLHVTAPGVYPLPGWGGELVVEPVDMPASCDAAVVDLSILARLALRPRSGAEQFQLGAGRPARSLKKQFQAMGLPASARGGPLLWVDDRLLFVPGLGIDAAWHDRDAPQPCTLSWRGLVVPMLHRGG
jgi:tRNA(Ile)-lysidine synthase